MQQMDAKPLFEITRIMVCCQPLLGQRQLLGQGDYLGNDVLIVCGTRRNSPEILDKMCQCIRGDSHDAAPFLWLMTKSGVSKTFGTYVLLWYHTGQAVQRYGQKNRRAGSESGEGAGITRP
jgi:hypothetical protein